MYWDDLEKFDSAHLKDYFAIFQNSKLREMFGSSEKQLTGKNYNQWSATLHKQNSFSIFSELLTSPVEFSNQLKSAGSVHSFCWLNPVKGMSQRNPEIAQRLEFELRENAPFYRINQFLEDENYWFGGLMDCLGSSEQIVELTAALPLKEFTQTKFNQTFDDSNVLSKLLKIHICIDDTQCEHIHFKQALVGYWKLFNVLQFLNDTSFCSKTMIELGINDKSIPTEENIIDITDAWSDVLEQTIIRENLELLLMLNIAIPEVGYELVIEEEVIGMTEFAWVDKKVALFSEEEVEDLNKFKELDWYCLIAPINDALIAKLTEKLGV